MATPQPATVRSMTVAEQTALERLTHASSARVDQVRRATALLAAAQGQPVVQAARTAGFKSGTTVADLVARFNRRGVAAVTITPGRGRTPTSDLTARARVVATAQRPPDRRADGTATWSLSTVQRPLRREAFPRLGATTMRRVLQDAGNSSQRSRTAKSDRDGATQAQSRGGDRGRSADGRHPGRIERAYRLAEAAGVPVWCHDEAGPYQAIPQPGASWQPEGRPACHPHADVRGGTAKLLTLFRPATGEVRATGVTHAPHVVLHPWLMEELTQVLAALPPLTTPADERPALASVGDVAGA